MGASAEGRTALQMPAPAAAGNSAMNNGGIPTWQGKQMERAKNAALLFIITDRSRGHFMPHDFLA